MNLQVTETAEWLQRGTGWKQFLTRWAKKKKKEARPTAETALELRFNTDSGQPPAIFHDLRIYHLPSDDGQRHGQARVWSPPPRHNGELNNVFWFSVQGNGTARSIEKKNCNQEKLLLPSAIKFIKARLSFCDCMQGILFAGPTLLYTIFHSEVVIKSLVNSGERLWLWLTVEARAISFLLQAEDSTPLTTL